MFSFNICQYFWLKFKNVRNIIKCFVLILLSYYIPLVCCSGDLSLLSNGSGEWSILCYYFYFYLTRPTVQLHKIEEIHSTVFCLIRLLFINFYTSTCIVFGKNFDINSEKVQKKFIKFPLIRSAQRLIFHSSIELIISKDEIIELIPLEIKSPAASDASIIS